MENPRVASARRLNYRQTPRSPKDVFRTCESRKIAVAFKRYLQIQIGTEYILIFHFGNENFRRRYIVHLYNDYCTNINRPFLMHTRDNDFVNYYSVLLRFIAVTRVDVILAVIFYALRASLTLFLLLSDPLCVLLCISFSRKLAILRVIAERAVLRSDLDNAIFVMYYEKT